MNDITVVIPHIPIREAELARALASVRAQTLQPAATIVAIDTEHEGSAVMRNAALLQVTTDWVAFLDDDDELLPNHLAEVMQCALETGADVVYPGCTVVGGHDPHDRFGQPFDPVLMRQKSYIPVTSLVRMSLVRHLFEEYGEAFYRANGTDYDDWGFYLRLLDAGAIFMHHPVKTWKWHHWGYGVPGRAGNTSGMPHRWG